MHFAVLLVGVWRVESVRDPLQELASDWITHARRYLPSASFWDVSEEGHCACSS